MFDLQRNVLCDNTYLILPFHQLLEPLFCCTLQALKQKEDDLAREVELLKQKLNEIEQLARGQGLSGVLGFRSSHAPEGSTSATPA